VPAATEVFADYPHLTLLFDRMKVFIYALCAYKNILTPERNENCEDKIKVIEMTGGGSLSNYYKKYLKYKSKYLSLKNN
jgi:hypothetical protein